MYPFPEDNLVRINKEGEEQIKKAAEVLKNKKIDLIFSSDILRTKQTSRIVSSAIKKKVIFDKRLRETNFGDFHGKSLKSYYNYFSNFEERFVKKPSGGESWNDLIKRLKSFIKEVEKKHKDKNILIISHGDPLRFLLKIIKKEDLKKKIKIFRLGELKEIK